MTGFEAEPSALDKLREAGRQSRKQCRRGRCTAPSDAVIAYRQYLGSRGSLHGEIPVCAAHFDDEYAFRQEVDTVLEVRWFKD